MSVPQIGPQPSFQPQSPIGAPGPGAQAPGADAGLPPALVAALLGNPSLQGPTGGDVAELGANAQGPGQPNQPPAELPGFPGPEQNPAQTAPPAFGADETSPFGGSDLLQQLTGKKPGPAEQQGPPAFDFPSGPGNAAPGGADAQGELPPGPGFKPQPAPAGIQG